MTLQQQVKNLLETKIEARERKNRYRTIWYILFQNIPEKEVITKEMFIDGMGKQVISTTRLICKLQKENVELRGTDYDDKEVLEQEKMLELGYNPGHAQQVKKLETL